MIKSIAASAREWGRSAFACGLAAFLAYLALTAWLTWPLALRMTTHVPHDLGDPVLNIWLMSWNARHVPFTDDWWNGSFFHPIPGALAFSEHVAGLVPITTPIIRLGGSPLLAYNVAFLLTFPLSGLAAYLLGRELTSRHDAAFVAGLAYAFAPYRVAQISHVDILSWYWMPLALLGLHRFRRTSSWRDLILFGVSWTMQVLCKGYALFYFSFVVLLWILWFVRPWRDWRTTVRLGLVWAIAALPLVPVFLHYRTIHSRYGLTRGLGEIEAFSADVAALLRGSPLLAHWPWAGEGSELLLFPGLCLVVLVAAAAGQALRAEEAGVDPYRRFRAAAAALAAVAAIVALSAVAGGPWRLELGPLKLSVRAAHKPLAIAWTFLIAALATSPRFLAAARRRGATAFYGAVALTCTVLSFGPGPRAFGTPIWDKGPYWWLLQLPGFASLRVPARFWMMSVLCLSALAALALVRLAPRRGAGRWALPFLAGAGIVWEGWMRGLPLLEPPSRSAALLESEPADTPVLEVPAGGDADAAALYRSMFHGHPLVNGFSGHEPPHYTVLRIGLERRDPTVLRSIVTREPLLVRLDRESDPDGTWRKWIEQHRHVRREKDGPGERVYVVAPRPPEVNGGTRLPVAAVRANVDAESAENAVDGDRRTFWSSGAAQSGRERIVLDLGAVHPIERVVLSLGALYRDYPRELRIELSPNGEDWNLVWSGQTAGPTIRAALVDPLRVPVSFVIGGAPGRFVRLRQISDDTFYGWSIVEAEVFRAETTRPTVGVRGPDDSVGP